VTLASHADGVTPAEKAMLEEHLPYELDMLEAASAFLHDEKRDRTDVAVRNAMIEAFWIHARNLIEFLTLRREQRDGATGVASARDFTKKTFSSPDNLGSIVNDVNDQITHLRYERKTSPQEKLAGWNMDVVRPAILSGIEKFEDSLQEQYKPLWVWRSSHKSQPVLATMVTTTATIKGVLS